MMGKHTANPHGRNRKIKEMATSKSHELRPSTYGVPFLEGVHG